MFLSSAFFFKMKLFPKIFQKRHQGVKQFGSRSGPTLVGPEFGPNCLQRFSADDKNRRRRDRAGLLRISNGGASMIDDSMATSG